MKTNPNNYDAWFDYLRLMESEADPDAVREVYERAIANIPPAEEKRLWRRYIYLWINYALYEELLAKVCSIFAAVGLRGCRSSLQKKLTRISSSSQSVFCYLRWIRAVLSLSFHRKPVHLSSPYSPGFFFTPLSSLSISLGFHGSSLVPTQTCIPPGGKKHYKIKVSCL